MEPGKRALNLLYCQDEQKNPPSMPIKRDAPDLLQDRKTKWTRIKKEIQGPFSRTKDPSVQALQLAEADEAPAVIPVIVNPVGVELAVVITEEGIRRIELMLGAAPAAVVIRNACMVSSGLVLHHPGDERGRMTSKTLRLEILSYFIRRDLAPRLPDERLESLATAADDLPVEALEKIPLFVVGIDVSQVATSFCEGDELFDGEVVDVDDVRRPIFVRIRHELSSQRPHGTLRSPGRLDQLRELAGEFSVASDCETGFFFCGWHTPFPFVSILD